jgi:peptidyl-prolyl cis-trans isomerase SurA
MKKLFIIFISYCIASVNISYAQKEKKDKVLLTIDNHKITKSEFERIYRKNNTSTVYDNKTVEEYLELFINYKLKVIEAESLGYDTNKAFIKELNGYREHLIKPYLEDNKIKERYLREAYDRTVTEVNVSHILAKFPKNYKPEDTLEAYNKINQIRERILAGESFEDVARETSEDPSAKENGGKLGWFTAFRMVYEFETASYNTPVGVVSEPFKTSYGYHIIRVNDKRPSKGMIKLAHIMIRISSRDNEEEVKKAEEKINMCYELLKEGTPFGDVATKYSEDRGSAPQGGVLRWIRSGVLPDSLENVLYNLGDSGSISKPMLLDFGWHIFELIKVKPVGTYEEEKPELEKALGRNPRYKLIQQERIKNIKKENNFVEYRNNLENLVDILDTTIYERKWDYTLADELIEPLFKIGDREYLQKDLAEYISKGRYRKYMPFDVIVNRKYDEFVEASVVNFEKSTLEDKYPDLRYLMQEYHDGILLFNLTDSVIWSKAIKDTAGLREFYNNNKSKYLWQERADVSTYTLTDSTLLEKAEKLALMRAKKEISKEDLMSGLCPENLKGCVRIVDNKFEKGDNELVDKMAWEEYNSEVFSKGKKLNLVVINGILEPEPKLLDEARGLVTADYQTYLDAEWIKALRNKYNIEVDRKVLKKVK